MCEVLSEIQHLLNISVIFGSENNRRDHWQILSVQQSQVHTITFIDALLAMALVKHNLRATINSGHLKPF